jgi:hypothetical protein
MTMQPSRDKACRTALWRGQDYSGEAFGAATRNGYAYHLVGSPLVEKS